MMQDYARARQMMVDGQLRPNRITAAPLLAAMRMLPRERFLPAGQAPFAYLDDHVPLPDGRALMEPLVLARLIQSLMPLNGARALAIGAGAGYGACLMAACGAKVTALEDDPALLAMARPLLAEFAPDAMLAEGPPLEGWPSGGPYDVILLEAGTYDVPARWAEQVAPGGKLAAAVLRRTHGGHLTLSERVGLGWRRRVLFDGASPALPGLIAEPGFVF